MNAWTTLVDESATTFYELWVFFGYNCEEQGFKLSKVNAIAVYNEMQDEVKHEVVEYEEDQEIAIRNVASYWFWSLVIVAWDEATNGASNAVSLTQRSKDRNIKTSFAASKGGIYI